MALSPGTLDSVQNSGNGLTSLWITSVNICYVLSPLFCSSSVFWPAASFQNIISRVELVSSCSSLIDDLHVFYDAGRTVSWILAAHVSLSSVVTAMVLIFVPLEWMAFGSSHATAVTRGKNWKNLHQVWAWWPTILCRRLLCRLVCSIIMTPVFQYQTWHFESLLCPYFVSLLLFAVRSTTSTCRYSVFKWVQDASRNLCLPPPHSISAFPVCSKTYFTQRTEYFVSNLIGHRGHLSPSFVPVLGCINVSWA